MTGRSVEVLAADLNSKADISRVEDALKSDASITLLVNNARIGTFALTRLTYAVAPRFVARGTGTIINISSVAGIAPELLKGVYGGSEAYVLAFSLSLQHELAPKGIRIQTVLPGAISTEFWDVGGTPVSHLPFEIVMTADDLVDAALAGLDQRESIARGTGAALRRRRQGQRRRSVKSTMCRPSRSQERPSLAVREHWLW